MGDEANFAQQLGQFEHDGHAYNVRHDRCGRAFICVGGQPVYLENQTDQSPTREAYKMGDDQVQNQGAEGDQRYQDSQQLQRDQQEIQGSTDAPQNSSSDVPAPPVPAGANNPSINSDATINSDQSRADEQSDSGKPANESDSSRP